MSIRKVWIHLAISAALRYQTVKWTAYAILVALGVIRTLEPVGKSVLPEVIHWLKWMPEASGSLITAIDDILIKKASLGMKLLVRGP